MNFLIAPLLVSISSLGLVLWSVLAILQTQTQLQTRCREINLKAQHEVSVHLNKLLSLNSQAHKLRVRAAANQRRLQVVLASGNPFALGQAQLAQAKIHKQRKILAHQQQQLITESFLLRKRSHAHLEQELTRLIQQSQKKTPWLEQQWALRPSAVPALLVRPDQEGLAPLYSPIDDFSTRQGMASFWQVTIGAGGLGKKLLPTVTSFSGHCLVTIAKNKKVGKWKPQIQRAKPFLKWPSL